MGAETPEGPRTVEGCDDDPGNQALATPGENVVLGGIRGAPAFTRPCLPRQVTVWQAPRLLPAPPPACLASFLPGVPGTATPEEALNVAQAGREARGRGQRGLGWRPSPHLDTRGARTMTLICLASQTLQLFPIPSPLDAQSKSRRGVAEVRIFL